MWRKHFTILGALFVLFGLVLLMDFNILNLQGSFGGWVAADYRGYLSAAYLVWFFYHLAITTLAVASKRFRSLRAIHLWSAAISMVLLYATCSAIG
jgi:hypothetical protein